MTLKKWIKYVDGLDNVIIWGKNDAEPLFEGCIFEIPWTLINYKIGNTDKNSDEPIHLVNLSNKPTLIINVIDNI